MGENSAISWTDNTFNPWIGCTKISAGCKFCYADRENQFRKWNPAGWGPKAPRKRTSAENWNKPLRWNKQAEQEGVRKRVFCASLADIFDDHPSILPEWRADLWKLIKQTPNLDWLLLTKRPEKIIEQVIWFSPGCRPPDNVRFGTSIENQAAADRRIPEILKVPSPNFLSLEPLLGPVDLFDVDGAISQALDKTPFYPCDLINWVIVGGESGPGARPMLPIWVKSILRDCALADVPVFVKQMGSCWAKANHIPKDPKGGDMDYWPDDLKIREFPNA